MTSLARQRSGRRARLGRVLVRAGAMLFLLASACGRSAPEATSGPSNDQTGHPGSFASGAGGSAGQAPGAGSSGLPFRIPDGFVAERVAAPPLVMHPMFACFDDRGRLYVAGSSGHNLDARALQAEKPDVIRRLEDTDGDGRFDKSIVFADKLTFPQGVLWHEGAVYTASPPSLWRLEDTNGDGVADKRTELFTGFPFTGIADDLHGPCLGPDGLIYWGVGRFGYAIRRPGGPLLRKGQAPLVMRSRPDGRDVEFFCAAMGNPVEMAFTNEGEVFACGTFLSPEAMGAGLRDAVIHCVEGGVYSVRDRALSESKRTGDFLPPLSHLGVAAGSGLMRVRGSLRNTTGRARDARGEVRRGDQSPGGKAGGRGPNSGGGREEIELLSALFNMHKVLRHTLTRDGSTFRSRDEDFLVSDEPDFHPTDVLQDADCSLLVVDTGGWFRSCPTSQIARANVEGAIYRVRKLAASPPRDPRGLALDWVQATPQRLAERLTDDRFAVRDRAIAALARRGAGAVPALGDVLSKSRSTQARRNALWALARIERPEARAAARGALTDRAQSVRQVAALNAGLYRDQKAAASLVELLRTGTPSIRREAASALGRIGDRAAVPALLATLRGEGDRFLEHALVFALISLDDREATLPGLSDPNPRVRRGALLALDQMSSGRLEANQVTPLLDPAQPELQQAALWVIAHRREWAPEMAGLFRSMLASNDLNEAITRDLRRDLVAFSHDPSIQKVMAEALQSSATPTGTRVLILETIAEAAIAPLPEPWRPALRSSLTSTESSVVRQAVTTVRSLGLNQVDEVLLTLAADPARDEDLRVEVLATVANRVQQLDPDLFKFLRKSTQIDKPPLLRLAAARALGEAPLDLEQLRTLTPDLASAGPIVLPRLLPAFERSSDRALGEQLVAALEDAPGLRNVRPESLKQVLSHYPAEVQHAAEGLFKKQSMGEPEKAARLNELEPIVMRGNSGQGREVFYGTKAGCSSCHTVRAVGGRIGPDLSRIGAVRSARDLLEAIVFPSASFARGYEPYVVATRDGLVVSGLILRETSDTVSLMTTDRIEKSIRRPNIEEIAQARVSIMPQGLDARLSKQELADLVSFLQSLR